MEYYGTLEYVETSKQETRYRYSTIDSYPGGPSMGHIPEEYEVKVGHWRIKGPQPALMLARIVPGNAWHPAEDTTAVTDNLSNVENIRWLMLRYPLEVKSDRWAERLGELEAVEGKRRLLKTLDKRDASPSTFTGTLRDFQKQGLDFLLKSSGIALLADEMGLGKGVQAIAYLVTEQDALPALIIAPLVTLQNWKREIQRFTKKESGGQPLIDVIRSGKPKALPSADFHIINYELLGKRADDLRRAGIRTIVADEIQALRNYNTIKYRAIKELGLFSSVKHRIGLSGTPCYNHGNEIWGIVDFLYPGMLGTYQEFSKEFVDEWSGEILRPKRNALYEILTKGIMLRRRKEEVLSELPEKTRERQKIKVDTEYYHTAMRELIAKIDSQIGRGNTSLRLIEDQRRALAEGERLVAGISKAPHIIEFVEEIMETEEAVVVYVHHRFVHEVLMDKLGRHFPAHIIGGQSDNERQGEIDRFQNGQTKLMIAGLRAGNVGINLTAASYVIFGELDWSPAIHRQAEDRLHRIGQPKPVFAYYLEGIETFDEHIAEILVDKKLELDQIFGDTAQTEAKVADQRTGDLLRFVKSRFNATLDGLTADNKQTILAERARDEDLGKQEGKSGALKTEVPEETEGS